MICRPIKESDYTTAEKWWTGRGFPCVPKEMLPPTGGIVEDHCLGYLYLSNGGLSMTEFVVGNPEQKGFGLHKSIKILLKYLIDVAKENGCPRVFSSVKNESLIKIMESAGYFRTDESMTNMLYF